MEEINNHLSKVSDENNAQKEVLDKVLADNQAICEVAALQVLDGTKGNLLYMYAKVDDTGESEKRGVNMLSIVIDKAVVTDESAIYAKDEVLTALKSEMESTFPEYIIETSNYDVTKHEDAIHIQEQQVANKVAQQTRRGFAKTKFLDFLYYKGSTPFDAPFIVYKFDDKYGIWKHPNAAQYGFRLIYK